MSLCLDSKSLYWRATGGELSPESSSARGWQIKLLLQERAEQDRNFEALRTKMVALGPYVADLEAQLDNLRQHCKDLEVCRLDVREAALHTHCCYRGTMLSS